MLITPTVLLSPRTPVRLPNAQVDIPPPPPAPVKPGGSLLYQVLPVLLAALGMGIILVVGNLQGSGGTLGVLLLGSLLLVGGGAAVSVLMHRAQGAAYRRATRERIELYYRLLTNTRDRLLALLEEQRRVLLDKDPDPVACARVAQARAPRLWERSPADADFLVLRAGLGAQPSSVPVHTPRQPDPLVADPLVLAATELVAWANSVWGVPVGLPLVDGQSAGVCGPDPAVGETVRALLLQLATHHAPDEVKLVALLPSTDLAEWAWLRWLPHAWSEDRCDRYLAATPDEAAALSKRLEEVLTRRRETASRYTSNGSSSRHSLPVYVFVVVDGSLAERMPVLAEFASGQGTRLGATALFLAADRTHLPRGCKTILEVSDPGPDGRLIDSEGNVQPVAVLDRAPLPVAEQAAAALAPLRPRRVAAPSGLPSQAGLLDLLGVQAVEDLDVLERWQRGAAHRSLAVPIGVRLGGEPLKLDLHQTADGPHGLIAGSTGSGKSALLQALLLGLAASFHPHDLAMVLVDYKGGSTAGPLRDLPHLVGFITNLDGNLAQRALVALRAEIERRQALLSAAGCDDLDAYLARRRYDRSLDPLPHLVLVVDEFAELKTERPDFIHQLVRTARVGRSVGLHLILATQKPRPAVDDEIWANARFRICLRVEQPQDSHDVLKRPDAASLSGRGQGYLQVGHDEVFTLFQGAWGGAPYRPATAGATDRHEIVRVDLDGTRRPLGLDPPDANPGRDPTQAEALAQHLRRTADEAVSAALPKIWLPPLPDRITLPAILNEASGWDGRAWRPTHHWVEPVVGIVDDPAHRRQGPLRFDFARSGHLAVYGAPGAGKTTVLLTLAVSLALEHAPSDVHLYLLDFGGQALANLAALPHVGGVVLADEEEKLVRLLRHLLAELGRRKAWFGQAGVATLHAYRAATKASLPAVVVLIDNLPALLHTYPDLEDQVAQLAQQGGTVGIHLAITAASPTLVRLRLASSFAQALTLRLTDRADYGAVLSVPEGYEAVPLPGRGLVKARPTLECQIALPAWGVGEADQTATVRRLANGMDAAWTGSRPWRVRTLPEHVSLLDVLPRKPRRDGSPVAAVGLAEDELEPLLVDLRDGPHFAIAGPPRGGKSTLLRTWLLSLLASIPTDRLRLYVVDVSRDGLADVAALPGVHAIHNAGELSALLDEVEAVSDACLTQVLAIDDLEGLQRSADSASLARLVSLIRDRRAGVHVLLVGSSGSFGASYDGVGHAIKETQTGFVVGGSDYEDLQVLGITVPHAEASQGLPPGRGFYARRKRYVRLKVAESPAPTELSLRAGATPSPSCDDVLH
jgi:S-DNA-T family DNA segregation ATPase FtsK/SpoIIIE